MDVEALEGSWADQPFKLTSPARVRYADEHLAIERFELAARESTLSLSGSLPMTERAGPGGSTVDARAQLAALANYLPARNQHHRRWRRNADRLPRRNARVRRPESAYVSGGWALSYPSARAWVFQPDAPRCASPRAKRKSSSWVPIGARQPSKRRAAFRSTHCRSFRSDVPRKSGASTFKATIRGLNPGRHPRGPSGVGRANRAGCAALGGARRTRRSSKGA